MDVPNAGGCALLHMVFASCKAAVNGVSADGKRILPVAAANATLSGNSIATNRATSVSLASPYKHVAGGLCLV